MSMTFHSLFRSEEIAFYQGDLRERLIVNHAFQRLVRLVFFTCVCSEMQDRMV